MFLVSGEMLPAFITSVEWQISAQNSFNCWKFLKLTKPQHNHEIRISVIECAFNKHLRLRK